MKLKQFENGTFSATRTAKETAAAINVRVSGAGLFGTVSTTPAAPAPVAA